MGGGGQRVAGDEPKAWPAPGIFVGLSAGCGALSLAAFVVGGTAVNVIGWLLAVVGAMTCAALARRSGLSRVEIGQQDLSAAMSRSVYALLVLGFALAFVNAIPLAWTIA